MKGCVQWNPIHDWEVLPRAGLDLRTTRSVGQHLTHWATGAQKMFDVVINTLNLLPLFSIRILLISLPFSCLNSSNAFVLFGGVLKGKIRNYELWICANQKSMKLYKSETWATKLYKSESVAIKLYTRCSKNGTQCRSWSDCSLRAVWSESTLFAQAYMSQYLEFLR